MYSSSLGGVKPEVETDISRLRLRSLVVGVGVGVAMVAGAAVRA